jgi:hypothetical protein
LVFEQQVSQPGELAKAAVLFAPHQFQVVVGGGEHLVHFDAGEGSFVLGDGRVAGLVLEVQQRLRQAVEFGAQLIALLALGHPHVRPGDGEVILLQLGLGVEKGVAGQFVVRGRGVGASFRRPDGHRRCGLGRRLTIPRRLPSSRRGYIACCGNRASLQARLRPAAGSGFAPAARFAQAVQEDESPFLKGILGG